MLRRILVAAAFVIAACSVASGGGTVSPPEPADAGAEGRTQPPASVLFSTATKRVLLEVDYAPGAEPYTGAIGSLGDIWEIFRDNAAALFDGSKEIAFPSSLDQMERLDDVVATRFAKADILAIAAGHRTTPSRGDTVTFYAVFVDGVYVDEDGFEEPQIVGVSIGTTGVIAIFEPVIAGTASRGPLMPPLVEQSALVHEFGHAVGLVGIAVPEATEHADPEHVGHCTNPSCVMFWANEGATQATELAGRLLGNGSRVLFGDECLADVRAFAQGIE